MRKLSFLTLFFVLLLGIRVVFAQQILLQSIDTNSMVSDALLPHEEYRIPIQVSIPDLNSRTSFVEVQLPQREIENFEIIRVSEFLEGITSISARATDGTERFITLNWNSDGLMFGNVKDFHSNEFFHIRHDQNLRSHYMSKVIQTELDVLQCGGYEKVSMQDHHHHKHTNTLQMPKFNSGNSGRIQDFQGIRYTGHERFQAGASGSTVIDILLVYTPNAENWANIPTSGGMDFIVAEMMNVSQLTLDNSQIPVQLRVAALRPIAYNQDGINNTVGSGNHLRRLTASNDFNVFGSQFDGFMLEVHEMRKQYGADMVSALMEVNDVGGVAWLGTAAAPNPDLMFSLNRIQQMTTTFTFIHELGHNLGLGHSRNQNVSAAGIFGGAFEYSTGWRFTGSNDGMSYATVMTYEEGSQRIPFFSNPNVSFAGTPTGSYSSTSIFAPADAAKNIRNTAPYVAGILPTQVNPPVLNVEKNPINITLEPGALAQHTLTVSNTGQSRLFVRPEITAVVNSNLSLSPPDIDWYERHFGNLMMFPGIGAAPLWGSSFGDDVGFTIGEFSSKMDWRVNSRNQIERFEVRETTPGNQGLVLKRQPNISSGSFPGIRSAYDGFFPYGGYEFVSEIMISNPDQNTFYISLFDPTITYGDDDFAIIVFTNSQTILFVRNFDENGNWVTQNTGVNWIPNEMKTIRMLYQPEAKAIHYYYDGIYLGSSNPLAAKKPVSVMYQRTNQSGTSEMIINSAFLNPLYDGLGFIEASPERSIVQAGLSTVVELNFDTTGLPSGVYNAQLELHTNDPQNPVSIIPVNLTVSGDVSVPQNELPYQLSLEQNYPNPFNPSTTIQFSIPEASDIRLELYNIAGQRVMMLKDGFVAAGTHTITLDASHLSSGVYLYRLSSESGILTRKMTLLK